MRRVALVTCLGALLLTFIAIPALAEEIRGENIVLFREGSFTATIYTLVPMGGKVVAGTGIGCGEINMLKSEVSHVGFSDESHWNEGRYRSLSLVTLPIEFLRI